MFKLQDHFNEKVDTVPLILHKLYVQRALECFPGLPQFNNWRSINWFKNKKTWDFKLGDVSVQNYELAYAWYSADSPCCGLANGQWIIVIQLIFEKNFRVFFKLQVTIIRVKSLKQDILPTWLRDSPYWGFEWKPYGLNGTGSVRGKGLKKRKRPNQFFPTSKYKWRIFANKSCERTAEKNGMSLVI